MWCSGNLDEVLYNLFKKHSDGRFRYVCLFSTIPEYCYALSLSVEGKPCILYKRFVFQDHANPSIFAELLSGGLFIVLNLSFLTKSPEGLIRNNIIIEIKCPYLAKDFTHKQN